MKLSRIGTIHLAEHLTLFFVRLHTDEALIGHGETKYAPDAERGFIHQDAAPLLLGEDPYQFDRHWRTTYDNGARLGLQVWKVAPSRLSMSRHGTFWGKPPATRWRRACIVMIRTFYDDLVTTNIACDDRLCATAARTRAGDDTAGRRTSPARCHRDQVSGLRNPARERSHVE